MSGRIHSDRRGGVTIIVALAMPIVLGLGAFAIDLGSAALETRKLQGIADTASLAAAADPSRAQAAAEQAVAAAAWPRPIDVVAVTGGYSGDATLAPGDRFVIGAPSVDAVRVTLTTPSPSYFARIFGQPSIPIARTATAARERLASFSIGSRLASVNGGLLNGYLSALTGSSVSLSVLDYNALAGADVDLFGMLDALHTSAAVQAGSYRQAIDAQITTAQALNAAAAATTDTATAQALRTLASRGNGRTLSLEGLIDPGSFGGRSSGGSGVARVNAMALATAILQLGSPTRQVTFDLAAAVPGVVATRVTLAIGERPVGSPWIAISDKGEPIVRTAQARLYVDARIGTAALPGIAGLAAIRLPLYAELASAEARLDRIDCADATGRSVTLAARPNAGSAAIADIDASRLDDFGTAMPLNPARLVDTLLVDIDGSAQIDAGAAEAWQSVRFDDAAINAGAIRSISSAAPVQGIASSLIGRIGLSVRVVGLPINLGNLTGALGTQLSAVAPALDTLIDATTGSLGVHYGEADLRVTGMRCGTAVLVG